MRELKEAPRSMLKFEGSPSDVGAQIWERMCNPAVRAVTGRPERERAQLYAGILMAAMGSMAADFGHERATDIVRDLTEAFAGMAGELEGGLTLPVTRRPKAGRVDWRVRPVATTERMMMEDNAEGCARLESEAQIVNGKLIISLRISTLAHAARHSDYFFRCAEDGTPLKITDEAVFAKSVAYALNAEEEDGSTPITRMLEAAFEHVSEQGEEGVEEA